MKSIALAGMCALLGACVGTIENTSVVPQASGLARKLAPTAPTPAWEKVFPADNADFVHFIDDDRVLLGTLELGATLGEPEFKGVLLVNAHDGTRIWEAERRHVREGRYTVVATEPKIVLAGANRDVLRLIALDRETGGRLWESEHKSPRARALSPDGKQLFLLTTERVFLSTERSRRTVSAIDLATGQTAWSQELQAGPVKEALELHADEGTVYLVGQEITRLAAAGGNILWSVQSPAPETAEPRITFVDGGVLFIGEKSLSFVDQQDGRIRWRRALERGLLKAAVAHDGRVLMLVTLDPANPGGAGDGSDEVLAVDLRSGTVGWQRSIDGTTIGHAVVGDMLAISTEDDILGLDAGSGTVRFRTEFPPLFRLASPLEYSPAGQADVIRASGQTLFVARESAGIVAYEIPSGKQAWRHSNVVARPTAYPYSAPARLNRLYETLAMNKIPVAPAARSSTKAFALQPPPLSQRLQRDYSRLEMDRRGASSAGDRSEVRRISQAQRANLNSQISALQSEHAAGVAQARLAFASALVGSASQMADAMQRDALMHTTQRISMEIDHTAALHRGAFQSGYYVRPFQVAGADGVQGLTLVDLHTGKRTEVLTSPYLEITTRAGVEMPQIVIDPAAQRLITVGIGLRPELWEERVARTTRQPRPSLLAYDIGRLSFGAENIRLEQRLAGTQVPSPEIRFVYAAQAGNVWRVQRMLASGINVNVRDARGRTALIAACEGGRENVVRALLYKGADVNIVVEKRAALDVATDPALQKMLRDAGAKKAVEL